MPKDESTESEESLDPVVENIPVPDYSEWQPNELRWDYEMVQACTSRYPLGLFTGTGKLSPLSPEYVEGQQPRNGELAHYYLEWEFRKEIERIQTELEKQADKRAARKGKENKFTPSESGRYRAATVDWLRLVERVMPVINRRIDESEARIREVRPNTAAKPRVFIPDALQWILRRATITQADAARIYIREMHPKIVTLGAATQAVRRALGKDIKRAGNGVDRDSLMAWILIQRNKELGYDDDN